MRLKHNIANRRRLQSQRLQQVQRLLGDRKRSQIGVADDERLQRLFSTSKRQRMQFRKVAQRQRRRLRKVLTLQSQRLESGGYDASNPPLGPCETHELSPLRLKAPTPSESVSTDEVSTIDKRVTSPSAEESNDTSLAEERESETESAACSDCAPKCIDRAPFSGMRKGGRMDRERSEDCRGTQKRRVREAGRVSLREKSRSASASCFRCEGLRRRGLGGRWEQQQHLG